MTNFKTNDWDLRNAWPLGSGETAVREALIRVENNTHLGGFSVICQRTNAVWHYGLLTTTIAIWDENFTAVQSISLGHTLPTNTKIPLTYAIVEDEIIITSPYFATVWGLVGNGLIAASKVTSVNPNTTAIDIPKGLCVSWGGRAVISDGASLYFSDALAPRTFVAENIIDPPGGTIYGMHVNAGGALILVTSTGVYALPEDASASGQIVLGIFSKLTDYRATDFITSAVSHGNVYGLTKKGYRRIDTAGSNEVLLDESVLSRSATARIAFEDYRLGRILSGEHGPVVSIGGYVHLTDLATNLETWWIDFNASTGTTGKRFSVTGLYYDVYGQEFFATQSGALILCGNRDDLHSANERSIGYVAGRITTPPEKSPVIRQVEFATDSEETVNVFINNATKSLAPQFVSPIIGTDVWDSGVYREVPLRSRQTSWAVRGDEVTMELKVTEYPSRLPPIVDVAFAGPGKNRPNT